MIEELDLHGEKHADVDRLVENFVLLNKPPMTIICGNSSIMVKLVIDVLERHDIYYERWNYGTIKVL